MLPSRFVAEGNEIRLTLADPCDERERTRLAYIVASFAADEQDADELARRALERFRNSACT